MASFPVKVIKPGQVAGIYYVSPPNTKVKDALRSANIAALRPDEEVLLNGKPVTPEEELLPQDTLKISKKAGTESIITVLPKAAGGCYC